MLKRFEDSLARKIDEVALKGFSFIEWWELKSWYERDRISKGVWRDIYDRFKLVADDESAKLYVYHAEHGALLIHSDGLNNITSGGIWEHVSGSKFQEIEENE